MLRRFNPLLICLYITALLLTNCTPLLVGGGILAGGLTIADRRNKETIIEDRLTELTTSTAIRLRYPKIIDLNKNGKITKITGPVFRVVSYNHHLLILGITENETQKREIISIVRRQKGVEVVYDYLRVKGQRRLIDITNDASITTRAKLALLTILGPALSNDVKIVTYDQTVYVFGLLTVTEQKKVVQQIRVVPGVKKVVALFEHYEPVKQASSSKTEN